MMKQVKDIMLKINLDLCNHCGACSYICSTGTITSVGDTPQIKKLEKCSNCGMCEEICPTGAISIPFFITFKVDLNSKDDLLNLKIAA
jgi:ferredoxin